MIWVKILFSVEVASALCFTAMFYIGSSFCFFKNVPDNEQMSGNRAGQWSVPKCSCYFC